MYNQQEDPIGISRIVDRFAINRYDYDDLQPGLMYREYNSTVTSHPSNISRVSECKNTRQWVSDELSRYKREHLIFQISYCKDYYIIDFRGYFRPDKTGYYRFGISCDDVGYIVLKDWNTIVASWFGGHGSKGTIDLVEQCMDIIT